MTSRSDFASSRFFNPGYSSISHKPVKNSYYPRRYINTKCNKNNIEFPGSSEWFMAENANNYLPFGQNESVAFPHTNYPPPEDTLKIGPKDYADKGDARKDKMSSPDNKRPGFTLNINYDSLLIFIICIIFIMLVTQIIQLRTHTKMLHKVLKNIKFDKIKIPQVKKD